MSYALGLSSSKVTGVAAAAVVNSSGDGCSSDLRAFDLI